MNFDPLQQNAGGTSTTEKHSEEIMETHNQAREEFETRIYSERISTSGYPNSLTISSNIMVWGLLLIVGILDR
jgi:hypothetical protein